MPLQTPAQTGPIQPGDLPTDPTRPDVVAPVPPAARRSQLLLNEVPRTPLSGPTATPVTGPGTLPGIYGPKGKADGSGDADLAQPFGLIDDIYLGGVHVWPVRRNPPALFTPNDQDRGSIVIRHAYAPNLVRAEEDMSQYSMYRDTIAPIADLATLKADPKYGDGIGPPGKEDNFEQGQYLFLKDNIPVHWVNGQGGGGPAARRAAGRWEEVTGRNTPRNAMTEGDMFPIFGGNDPHAGRYPMLPDLAAVKASRDCGDGIGLASFGIAQSVWDHGGYLELHSGEFIYYDGSAWQARPPGWFTPPFHLDPTDDVQFALGITTTTAAKGTLVSDKMGPKDPDKNASGLPWVQMENAGGGVLRMTAQSRTDQSGGQHWFKTFMPDEVPPGIDVILRIHRYQDGSTARQDMWAADPVTGDILTGVNGVPLATFDPATFDPTFTTPPTPIANPYGAGQLGAAPGHHLQPQQHIPDLNLFAGGQGTVTPGVSFHSLKIDVTKPGQQPVTLVDVTETNIFAYAGQVHTAQNAPNDPATPTGDVLYRIPDGATWHYDHMHYGEFFQAATGQRVEAYSFDQNPNLRRKGFMGLRGGFDVDPTIPKVIRPGGMVDKSTFGLVTGFQSSKPGNDGPDVLSALKILLDMPNVGHITTLIVGSGPVAPAQGQFSSATAMMPTYAETPIVTIPAAWGPKHGGGGRPTPAFVQQMKSNFDNTLNGSMDSQINDALDAIYSKIPVGSKTVKYRIGHEAGGLFEPHASFGNEELYAQSFRHVANLIKAKDPNAVICWIDLAGAWMSNFDQTVDKSGNPRADPSQPLGLHVKQSYPGDDIVDVVGYDLYSRAYRRLYTLADWNATVQPGLDDLFRFARDATYRNLHAGPTAKPHAAAGTKKKVGFSEWGYHVGVKRDPEPTAADDGGVVFIEKMYEMLTEMIPAAGLELDHACYFTPTEQNRNFDITAFPKTAARFFQLFGHQR